MHWILSLAETFVLTIAMVMILFASAKFPLKTLFGLIKTIHKNLWKKMPHFNPGLWLNYLKQCSINIHKTNQMNTWIWHLINIRPHMHINKTYVYSYRVGIHIYEDSTWQVVKGLMLQRNCGMSWMETCRLKEFALKSRVLGSSRRRPPRPRSTDTTSCEE